MEKCKLGQKAYTASIRDYPSDLFWVAVVSAKNHKRQRRKRQSLTAKREKS